MVRVACTHSVNPPGTTLGGAVLCSLVALDWFTFWRIRVRIDICRFGSTDLELQMSCGKETPARPNRFESPQLLGEEDSINCDTS
jgi:hypothetical protein